MKNRCAALACGIGLVASAIPALAAGLVITAGADLMDLSLEQLMSIPVRSASGFEQRMSDAPSSVTIVTRQDILAFGYRTLAEAVSSAAGFYIGYDRAYHSIGVRGFSRPGDYNTRTLILINGVRVNEPIYGMGRIGGEFPLDIDLIERIEIVRGPSASLYGSAAFFGIINVITRDAGDIAPAEASLAAGSHGALGGRVTWAHLSGDRGSLLVSGSMLRTGGDDLYFPLYDDPEHNDGVAEGLDGEEIESVFLRAAHGDFALQAVYLNRSKDRPTASFGTIFNDPGGYDRDREASVSLSWEGDLSADWAGLFRTTYQRYWYEATWPYDYSEEAGDPKRSARCPGMSRTSARADKVGQERYVDRDESESESVSGMARVIARIVPGHVISAGADVQHAFSLEQRYIAGGERVLDENDRHTHVGAYLQDEVALASWGLVNAGLRYDRVEPGGDQRFSPRTALIVKPFERSTMKLIYGEAFRAPNEYELHYDDGESTMKSNPDLDPETIRTYEAVLEQKMTECLRVNLSIYSYRVAGLITHELDPGDGLYVFRNLDAARATGGEVEASVDLPRGMRARLSYGYSDATDRSTGERLSNSPEHLARLNLAVPVVPRCLSAALEAQYIGGRLTVDRDEVGDALVVNTTLRFRRIANLDVTLSAYNLFETGYAHVVSDEIEGATLEQDGRTFRLKAVYAF